MLRNTLGFDVYRVIAASVQLYIVYIYISKIFLKTSLTEFILSIFVSSSTAVYGTDPESVPATLESCQGLLNFAVDFLF